MVGIFLPCSKYGKVQLVTKNSPFRWKRGWSWPCFDKTLPALLCKCSSHANQYFLSKIYIRKGRRFVSNKVNLTFTQRLRHLKPTTVKWPIRRGIEANEKYFEWIILWLTLSVARIHQRFYFVYLPCLVEAEIKLVLNLLIPYNSSQSKTNLNIFFFLNSTYHRSRVQPILCKASTLPTRKQRMQNINMSSRHPMRGMPVRLR